MSIYRDLSEIELESHLSNFLVNNWSFSAVAQFARHEKAYEMQYIYNERAKTGASSVAGNAYHHALRTFFYEYRNSQYEKQFDLVDMEKFAFDYIEERPAYIWKLQKTTPTVEQAIKKATQIVVSLLRNFMAHKGLYLDDIAEIIAIEESYEEFLDINGVDIPLPCKGKIDMVIRLKNSKIVIIDNKSKASFTDEEEMKLVIGTQAITYVKLFEAQTGIQVDEVWFIENKYSENKDKTMPQLSRYIVEINNETRRLYEVLIYEKLKRLIEAVSNPDYVYLINDSDNMVDRAEVYAFWMKTMLSEIEEFNVPKDKQELVSKRLKKIRDASLSTINPKVIKNFQENATSFIPYDYSNKNMTPSQKIEHRLRTFGIVVNIPYVFDGYSSNTFLLEPSGGVKISSINTYRLDIASALDVKKVRISPDLVRHNGKAYVSIEATKERERTLMFDPARLVARKIPLGEDNYGNTIIWDLDNPSTPHAIVCGGTGSGKSVLLKTVIENVISTNTPVIILDPKNSEDLTPFAERSGVDKVLTEILDIEAELKRIVDVMEECVKTKTTTNLLLVIDEFADAIINSRKGNELDVWENVESGFYKQSAMEISAGCDPVPKIVNKRTGTLKSLEENLRILAQKSRSVGIRMMVAAQRIDTKVMTGNAKNNFPVQICFRVQRAVDSMVVLDEPGAEALTGKGDGLIKSPEYPDTTRFQAFYKP